MTCKLYHVLLVACAVALANQVCAATLANKTVGLAPTDAKNNSLRIPKLPPSFGVTLSGMEFASNSTGDSASPSDLGGKNSTEDPFTLPDFDQAVHYLEDREVSLIKLPLSWESLQQNITQLEAYTDVVATVTSRNASAIVTLSISSVHFSNFTSNATIHTDGKKNNHKVAEKEHHKKSRKEHHDDRNLVKDAASASFVELWGKLAEHFRHDRRVIFHLMAIPHGSILPRNWNQTVQDAVTNIRKSARNVIILPSIAAPNVTTLDSFRDFPKDFARMQNVTNPDGTTDGIIFDVTQTLGPKDNTSQRCPGVDVSNIVDPVVKILKEHQRQAIVGTLAAGSDPSCTRTLVKFAREVSKSYPALAGLVMYGAGAYDQNSPWALIKERQHDSAHCAAESAEDFVDQPNFKSVEPYFHKKAKTATYKEESNQ